MRLNKFFAQVFWPTAGLNLTWRKLLYRQLCKADMTPDYPFVTDFFGLKYQGNLNNSIEASILFYGAFEKPLLFFLRDVWFNLSNDSSASDTTMHTFVDIGANLGQHSLFMSKLATQVIAFEPLSSASSRLKHHIALNKIENIYLNEFALSDQEEFLDFFAPTGRNQGIGSFDASTIIKGNIATDKLELIRGDHYFELNTHFNIRLIKIDVEGFEKKVIHGLSKTLCNYRPFLVCEISYGKQHGFCSSQELIASLPENYQLFCFDSRNPDGSKAKKRGSKAKHSGRYKIVNFESWRESGQDDIIAVPEESLGLIPGFKDE